VNSNPTSSSKARQDSSSPTKKGPTALVVDGNGTSRRFVEMALGRGGFAVEAAQDAGGALEILKAQRVELIVCDTELADMSGMRFFRRLSQENRLSNIPFAFLTADSDAKKKVEAMRAGVDDYLVKPCDVAELVARAEALVRRQKRIRDQLRSRAFSLAGDLSVMSLGDVLNVIEAGAHEGVLAIVSTNTVGCLHFDGGRLVHATAGNVSGEDAFFALLLEAAGHFEFTVGPCSAEARTIRASTSALLRDAARFTRPAAASPVSGVPPPSEPRSGRPQTTLPPTPDHQLLVEAARMLDADFSKPVGELIQRPLPLPKVQAPAPRVPAARADSTVAAQFELALRDPFALGDLCIWTESELAEWTAREGANDRLHVHLVADLPSGVSALLALAGAPTEKWVLGSLSPANKAFGITFFMRSERQIDVVLIDASNPAAFLPSLRRAPAMMIVWPPSGSLVRLPIKARIELEQLIGQLKPAAVVGVGDETLERNLSAMVAQASEETSLRCTEALSGATADDFRALLVKGVRLWAGASRGR